MATTLGQRRTQAAIEDAPGEEIVGAFFIAPGAAFG
jgi:hypothetical protein